MPCRPLIKPAARRHSVLWPVLCLLFTRRTLSFSHTTAPQVLCTLCHTYYRPACDVVRCDAAAARAAALAAAHDFAALAEEAATAAAWVADERCSRPS